MSERRDPRREIDWLRGALSVDPTGLIAAALSRLDGVGRNSYGDTWADRTPADLIVEGREECADIAGWGVLTALHPAVRADTARGPRIDAEVAAAVELAARADAHLKRALQLAAEITA